MKKNSFVKLFGWIVGLASAIMSGTISWAMITGALFIPKVPSYLTMSAGWLLFVLTLLGVVLAIIGAVRKVWR